MISRDVRDSTLGIRGVGIPTDEIPESSLLSPFRAQYAGRLLRLEAEVIPTGTVILENGTYTGSPPLTFNLYVDGILVGPFSPNYEFSGGWGSMHDYEYDRKYKSKTAQNRHERNQRYRYNPELKI